jgi:16S rRNA (uracil1498-N3)-methyltransferase
MKTSGPVAQLVERFVRNEKVRGSIPLRSIKIMHRFFIPNADFKQSKIILTDFKEIHHLVHVLRLKKGSSVGIFNKSNEEGEGKILEISSNKVSIEIKNSRTIDIQLPLITLACAMPKKSKFETIIEKATELGVYEIIPLQTKRTEIILKGDREEKRLIRFQTVAINAAKQSKRVNVPQILPIMEFSKALEYLKENTTMIIPSLMGTRIPLIQALEQTKAAQRISFLIGPEGDFTAEEYRLAQTAGCLSVSLGETTLKVETAALCVIACAKQFHS